MGRAYLGESNKPFILSATDENGQQLMVKLLRMDSDAIIISTAFKEREILMECEACENGQIGRLYHCFNNDEHDKIIIIIRIGK